MNTRRENIQMVPPDGGWGWLIVLGSSLITFSTKAIAQPFGLLFGDFLRELGEETTGASLVTSTMDGMFHFSGIIVGPLIKKYTYRKVAFIGAVVSCSALILTTFVTTFLQLLILYGAIGGIGFSLINSCNLVGINDYFSKKKGQAVGLSMAGIGGGIILMPQIVRYLLDEYDFRSAVLLTGAISLHTFVGASLFQPVSWHKKPELIEEEDAKLFPTDESKKTDNPVLIETTDGPRRDSRIPALCNISSPKFLPEESLIPEVSLVIDTQNEFHIQRMTPNEPKTTVEKHLQKSKKKNGRSLLSRFSKSMDLDLLKDWKYLNIIYGLSMCIVGEMNFKIVLPFYLAELGFPRADIAYAMSFMGAADISARTLIPPIVDRLPISWRDTFLISLSGYALGLLWFLSLSTLQLIVTAIISVGIFQGITLTAYPLVLTEYSIGKNFPSVLGLAMVIKGIFIVVLVPLFGYLRDATKSYTIFYLGTVAALASAVIAWTVEKYFSKYKRNEQEFVEILQLNE